MKFTSQAEKDAAILRNWTAAEACRENIARMERDLSREKSRVYQIEQTRWEIEAAPIVPQRELI